MKKAMDFVKNELKEIIRVSAVYTIHYFEYSKLYTFEGERHPFWELIYADKGQVNITAGDKIIKLSQGEMLFHRPNEFHTVSATGEYANTVVISFECQSPAMSFFEKKKLKLDKVHKDIVFKIINEGRHTFNEPLNIVDLTCMTQSPTAEFGALQMIKLYLEELLVLLVRDNNVLSSYEKSKKWRKHESDVFGTIIDYLEKNIEKNITLDDVCNKFFFSKTYIKNLFKDKTGKGMIHYFNELKVNKAKQIISLNEFTFTEVSEMLSYGSVHYFSRVFKEYTGMTPSEYSRSIKSTGIL